MSDERKRLLNESADWREPEFFARQGEIADPVFGSEDARAGARAFAERPPPLWQWR